MKNFKAAAMRLRFQQFTGEVTVNGLEHKPKPQS
jgi:hypothetical protein